MVATAAPSVKSFEMRLDLYWKEIKFNYKADFVYSPNTILDFSDDESSINIPDGT